MTPPHGSAVSSGMKLRVSSEARHRKAFTPMPCCTFVLGADFLPPTKGMLEQADRDAPRATPETSTTATFRTRALLRLIKRSLRKLRDVRALARTRARHEECRLPGSITRRKGAMTRRSWFPSHRASRCFVKGM